MPVRRLRYLKTKATLLHSASRSRHNRLTLHPPLRNLKCLADQESAPGLKPPSLISRPRGQCRMRRSHLDHGS